MFKFIFYGLREGLRSKLGKIYLIGTFVLILVANIAVICFRFVYGTNEGTFAYNVFEYASWCFLIPYYSCILLGLMAFGRDYIHPKKHGTPIAIPQSNGIDDVVTLKPWQIYVSKLMTSALLAAVYLVIAAILLYVITALFHLDEGIVPWPIMKSFLQKAALALPLWFAGLSFAIMFLFLFESKVLAFIGFVVVAVVIPQLIRIFSLDSFNIGFLRDIRTYTITQNFGLIPYPSYPERSVPLIVALGLVYGFIAMVIGLVSYNRKAS